MLAFTRQRVLGQSFTSRNGCRTLLSHEAQIWQRSITDLSDHRKDLEAKYADKLLERVKREGVASVEELKTKVTAHSRPPEPVIPRTSDASREEERRKLPKTPVRKDSSPVKASTQRASKPDVSHIPRQPLADIMDLKKILSKNHTAEEVSALWTTYHATRSQGTGRGYLSATIPLASYLKMSELATKFRSFILPLPRPSPEPDAASPAHEFHFLQWGFHETPPHPAQTPSLPFDEPGPAAPASALPNPAYSTVLFTSLQEYKLRLTFAQPQLVLTHYTDFATTHGIVLMRGEITASLSSPEKYLLSQVDAQLLALGVQRFYLPTDDYSSMRRVDTLRRFHEAPKAFRWQDMLVFADPTA